MGPPRLLVSDERRCRQAARTRALGLALVSALSVACGKDPQATRRAVTVHVPSACAADGNAYATYSALGDFEPTALSRGHALSAVGDDLAEIGASTRSLVVEATEGDREWRGAGAVPASGNVDLLILPWLRSCPLSTQLGSRTGSTVGSIGGSRVLVVGGKTSTDEGGIPTTAQAVTFVARLDTGELAPASPDLRTPRTQASVTAFGLGGIVAGGMDEGTAVDTAEVYVPEVGGFDQHNPIFLSTARADHGAVVLATGETLLVGGVGAGGLVLDSMEVVDPVTRTVRTQNVAALAVARRGPTVLRLASSDILVAGGYDAAGNAVPTVEWFSADASRASKQARDLVAGAAHAYAGLEGGGALAVIAPPPGAPPAFQSVWVIDADGSFEPAVPVPGSLARPVLFGGAGGAPVLWTGSLWLRWQPWTGAFGALGVLDDAVPQVSDVTTSPDPGLGLWLDAAAEAVTLLRFDVRGEYSTLPQPLLVTDASDLAPDRLVASGVVTFDPASGLALGPGAGAFVTGRTYADVVIDVEAPTGEPALVVLRDELGNELEVGGSACPGALDASGSPSSLHVERAGSRVSFGLRGGTVGTCPTGLRQDARVSVGVRGPASVARSLVRNLRVVRTRSS